MLKHFDLQKVINADGENEIKSQFSHAFDFYYACHCTINTTGLKFHEVIVIQNCTLTKLDEKCVFGEE